MYKVTVFIEKPNGRISVSQTYEYIGEPVLIAIEDGTVREDLVDNYSTWLSTFDSEYNILNPKQGSTAEER